MSALDPDARDWLTRTGFTVQDEALWFAALTHGSMGETRDYERLEFLGDRVLGLAALERDGLIVSRAMCAQVARGIGLAPHIRISRQASSDGGRDSDNILGDVMEALLGAQFLDNGFAAARDVVRLLWRPALESGAGKSKHPKSALQEWAAGNQRRPPEYELIERSGPDHAARFTVRVKVHKVGEAEGTAGSKQEAEKQAARIFMETFG